MPESLFFGLPLEIRTTIYQLCFDGLEIQWNKFCHENRTLYKLPLSCAIQHGQLVEKPFSLLGLNQMVRDEALPVLYQNLLLSMRSDYTRDGTTIPRRVRQHFPYIQIVGICSKDIVAFRVLRRQFTSLKMLVIEPDNESRLPKPNAGVRDSSVPGVSDRHFGVDNQEMFLGAVGEAILEHEAVHRAGLKSRKPADWMTELLAYPGRDYQVSLRSSVPNVAQMLERRNPKACMLTKEFQRMGQSK